MPKNNHSLKNKKTKNEDDSKLFINNFFKNFICGILCFSYISILYASLMKNQKSKKKKILAFKSLNEDDLRKRKRGQEIEVVKKINKKIKLINKCRNNDISTRKRKLLLNASEIKINKKIRLNNLNNIENNLNNDNNIKNNIFTGGTFKYIKNNVNRNYFISIDNTTTFNYITYNLNNKTNSITSDNTSNNIENNLNNDYNIKNNIFTGGTFKYIKKNVNINYLSNNNTSSFKYITHNLNNTNNNSITNDNDSTSKYNKNNVNNNYSICNDNASTSKYNKNNVNNNCSICNVNSSILKDIKNKSNSGYNYDLDTDFKTDNDSDSSFGTDFIFDCDHGIIAVFESNFDFKLSAKSRKNSGSFGLIHENFSNSKAKHHNISKDILKSNNNDNNEINTKTRESKINNDKIIKNNSNNDSDNSIERKKNSNISNDKLIKNQRNNTDIITNKNKNKISNVEIIKDNIINDDKNIENKDDIVINNNKIVKAKNDIKHKNKYNTSKNENKNNINNKDKKIFKEKIFEGKRLQENFGNADYDSDTLSCSSTDTVPYTYTEEEIMSSYYNSLNKIYNGNIDSISGVRFNNIAEVFYISDNQLNFIKRDYKVISEQEL